MSDSMFRDRRAVGRHKPRPPGTVEAPAKVAVDSIGSDITLKTDGTTSAKATTADGALVAVESTAFSGGGQLVSDLKTQDVLSKILYELKLLRMYAQAEAGGRELGVTAEELKSDHNQ